jgi:hypothetical protein
MAFASFFISPRERGSQIATANAPVMFDCRRRAIRDAAQAAAQWR